ncbi:unnamed protein product [Effrenium voratum]|nr:unnamed protein product [Effrenium voratum]
MARLRRFGLVQLAALVFVAPHCFTAPKAVLSSWRDARARRLRALPDFDLNSIVDRTEMQLCNTTLKLTSSVFGFPDYDSLLTLNNNGTARFYAGMVSKEMGAWSVVEGDPEEGEDPSDLYLEWTQPLTDTYKESFTVPGGTAFWRGKLNFRTTKSKKQKVFVEGGIVVSERDEGKKLVREGIFSAQSASAKMIEETIQKAREAFERALTTPKAETSGFKTPARIAGAGGTRVKKALPGTKLGGQLDKGDLDLLEDGKGKT